jgi:arabinose-5-phosphate isomerase
MNDDALCQMGRSVVETELDAVSALLDKIGPDFASACRLILDCKGRVIVLGMGKSGHIGNKIAATMASTGTPAQFVHAAEASHGDMGMITADDLVLAISNSGETEELVRILPLIKRLGVPLLAMTGNRNSTLAKMADIHLDARAEKEACPLGLAPTASTTAALVMGDALAIALLKAKGFTEEDFALSHPGGSLGRKLLLRMEDVMHSGDRAPMVHSSANLKEALLEMSGKGMGMTAIVDDNRRILGIFTDGDLRRYLDNFDGNMDTTKIVDIMTRNPKTILASHLASESLQLMHKYKVNGVLVVDDDGRMVGACNTQDLLRAGVI